VGQARWDNFRLLLSCGKAIEMSGGTDAEGLSLPSQSLAVGHINDTRSAGGGHRRHVVGQRRHAASPDRGWDDPRRRPSVIMFVGTGLVSFVRGGTWLRLVSVVGAPGAGERRSARSAAVMGSGCGSCWSGAGCVVFTEPVRAWTAQSGNVGAPFVECCVLGVQLRVSVGALIW
jgi:hypothetical protein